jgi:hypothetical protein
MLNKTHKEVLMKKSVLLLLALLLVVGLNAEVYLPVIAPYQTLSLESFRHIATTAIEDDLDNGIDGTDIFKVEGARIYTNMSNLVSSWENQADNSSSDNTVVIGAISKLYKGYRLAVFYGNGNYHGAFTGTATEVGLTNTDADSPFDWRTELNSDTSANIINNDNCILVNLGRVMGEETELALTYKRTISKGTDDYTMSRDYTATDLDVPSVVTDWEENGDGGSESSVPISLYAISYAKPFKDWKLRGDLYFYMGGMNNNLNQMYRYFEDNSPASLTETDDELDSNLVENTNDISGNLAGISLRLGDENEFGLWEVGGNFGMVFGSGDYRILSRTHSIERDQIGSFIEVYNATYNNENVGPISVSGMNMGLNGRIEWQISPNVRWGLGLIVNSFSASLEYDLDDFSTTRTVFNNGDNVPSDPIDYVTTSIGGGSYIRTMKLNTNSIVIPTGVEVSIGKKKDWFIRLGALANGWKNETTQTIDVDEASLQPDSTTTVWGDGSSSTTVDPSVNYTDSEVTSGSTYQNVDFIYGVGWKPSPNLSLDLVGMFDVGGTELLSNDWFKSLRLSATINVY